VVIPVHDINPLRRTPWMTWALIAANVIVFLLTPASQVVTGGATPTQTCTQAAFYAHWAAIPKEMTSNQPEARVPTGTAVATSQGPACLTSRPAYHKSPVLSVFTAMFLHGGWFHLLGNMLFLLIFGNNVEDRFGPWRFLVFYLFCGLVAAYGFAAANPHSTEPLIGASGAIAGVLGAYLVLYPRAKVWSLVPFLFFIPLRLPAWIVLGLWFVLQWVYTAGYAVSDAGSVAYLAHVVGFIVGAVLTALLVPREPSAAVSGPPRARW
jgi:membrane associated rhomboid family serine protease